MKLITFNQIRYISVCDLERFNPTDIKPYVGLYLSYSNMNEATFWESIGYDYSECNCQLPKSYGELNNGH